MYVSPQERPFDALASGFGGLGAGFENDPAEGANAFAPGDAVSRLIPPFGGTSALGPLGSLVSNMASPLGPANLLGPLLRSLGSLLRQLSQTLGGSDGSGGGSAGANCASSPQHYFENANGSSTGDPHLAFSGGGTDAHWDSMDAHPDLLDSNSFGGGFRISTQTTVPNANGVTFNRSAGVATHDGNTRVTLDNAGHASVEQNGRTFAIANGQSYDLGGGERVSRGADGALSIDEHNGRGGEIETTLRGNGSGVDVSVRAQNVDLGGDLANGGAPDPVLMPLPRVGVPSTHVRPPHHVMQPVETGYDE